MSTHTPAEWAAALSLGTGAYATGAALLLLLVDADAPAWWPDAAQRAHARETAAHAVEQARLRAVAWLLVAAIYLDPTPAPEASAR